MVVTGGVAVSYERGTPVPDLRGSGGYFSEGEALLVKLSSNNRHTVGKTLPVDKAQSGGKPPSVGKP